MIDAKTSMVYALETTISSYDWHFEVGQLNLKGENIER
jgi:hypothetical protein